MAIYVTGDLHGGFEIEELRAWYSAHRRELGLQGYVIGAGDFGFPSDDCFGEEEDIRWMESRLPHPLFVDGNHEHFDYWAKRPVEEWKGGRVQRLTMRSPIRHLMRGEVYDLGGGRSSPLVARRPWTRTGASPARVGGPRSCPARRRSSMRGQRLRPMAGRLTTW